MERLISTRSRSMPARAKLSAKIQNGGTQSFLFVSEFKFVDDFAVTNDI